MAAKKPAKLATDKPSVAVAIRLTRRPCEHCGEFIPSDKVLTIKRTTVAADGTGGARMVYYIKGHESL